MIAKSQDVLVALKWLVQIGPTSYARLAKGLGMSVGEVHEATHRLAVSGLFDPADRQLNPKALREYLIYGVKYAFPAKAGEPARGMRTSYAVAPLREHLVSPRTITSTPVWPDPKGDIDGYSLIPLFPTVPFAARNDANLYELLSLVDALREGRARERCLCERLLSERIQYFIRLRPPSLRRDKSLAN